jgi:hypothetical protein
VICPDKVHPSDHKEKTHLHYTYLVDAWAVGVLAYELTVGRAPFDAGHKRGTIDNILHAQPRFPGWISDSARHFVSWSLTKDAAKRPGIQQLAEHPWIHQHAAPARAKLVNPGRAASCFNLMQQPGSTAQAAGQQQPQPRHKMGASDAEVRLTDLQEDEEELFVSAHGDPMAPAAAASAAAADAASPDACAAVAAITSSSKLPLPGGAVAITATSGSAAAAVPAPGTSPFAASAGSAPSASAASGGVLGAAADKLRAFVHRCQSANDLDGLKSFMMSQPPEPSNACFEPGGRFYKVPAQQAQQQAAATAQQQQQQQQPAVVNASAHDSATSMGTSPNGSSSSSRAQQEDAAQPQAPAQPLQEQRQFGSVVKPLAAPAAAGCFGPSKPLQLIRLPQAGRSDSSKGAASPDGSKGSADMELHITHASLPAGSPMAVSPAALIRTTSGGTSADQLQRPFSRASTDSSSSSCAENAARDNSSICSSHSWGYGQAGGEHSPMDQSPTTHQQLQHAANAQMLPPRPHTPPRLKVAAMMPTAAAGPTAGSKLSVMSGPAAAGVTAAQAAALAAAAGAAGCSELDQLVQACKSAAGGMGQVALNISADCRGVAMATDEQQLQQDQQAAAMTINSCFGFLKTNTRR